MWPESHTLQMATPHSPPLEGNSWPACCLPLMEDRFHLFSMAPADSVGSVGESTGKPMSAQLKHLRQTVHRGEGVLSLSLAVPAAYHSWLLKTMDKEPVELFDLVTLLCLCETLECFMRSHELKLQCLLFIH